MSVDVRDREQLEAWLEKQPREVVVSIATRSALRVLPLLELKDFSVETAYNLIFSVFRAVFFAWGIAQYPEKAKTLLKGAQAVVRTPIIETDANPDVDAVVYAARAAVARAAASYATGRTSFTAAARAASFAITPFIFMSSNAALNFDVNTKHSYKFLNNSFLWETEEGVEFPDEIIAHWETLKSNLLALNPNWQVWTDWYEARLYPNKFPAPNKTLELARAQIPNKIWDQGWEVVNPYIEKLIEENTPPDVGIGPSAFHFYTDGGKIQARPVVQADVLNELCSQLYERTKQSLNLALENESPNRPLADWLKDYIHQINEALGASPDEVKPGQLLFVSKDIESDKEVFEIENNQVQIALSDHRLLKKMSAWLDELLPCLEKVRAHEAAKLALGIQRQDAEQINAYADEIIETARQSDIVDETAIKALKSRDEALVKDKERMDSDDERVAVQGRIDYAENVSLKVLENRNFVRRSLDFGKQELQEITKRSYQGAKDGFVKGVEKSATAGVVAFSAMAVGLVNPLAGLAVLIACFRKDEKAAKTLMDEAKVLDAEQENVSTTD